MTIRLYTRAGCHLCEQVEAQLARLAPAAALERRDIDRDPRLRERYGLTVPVVVIDRQWVLVARIDEPMLRDALARAQSRV